MTNTIKIKDQEFPVTEAWAAHIYGAHPDLQARSTAALETERDNLLRLSGERRRRLSPMPEEGHEKHHTLSPAEGERLENLVHVLNVHYAAAMLEGRDLADFGFTGVDQVHGNDGPAPCGCVLAFVFDHHTHQAQAWARDLQMARAVLDLLSNDPATPPFALTLQESRVARCEQGQAHHARLAGHAGKDLAEILALEITHHPHVSYHACEHHKHLKADPAAHHDQVRKDATGASAALAAAHEAAAKAAAEKAAGAA